jgi:hypothetical protein
MPRGVYEGRYGYKGRLDLSLSSAVSRLSESVGTAWSSEDGDDGESVNLAKEGGDENYPAGVTESRQRVQSVTE